MALLLEDGHLHVYDARLQEHDTVHLVAPLDYGRASVEPPRPHEANDILHDLRRDVLEVGDVEDHPSAELEVEVVVDANGLGLPLVIIHIEPRPQGQENLGILPSRIVEHLTAHG